MCSCNNIEVKIVPTYESAWGIEDRYNIVCIKCNKNKAYRVSEEDAYDIIKDNNYLNIK